MNTRQIIGIADRCYKPIDNRVRFGPVERTRREQ